MTIYINDASAADIYTLSLHDALPICAVRAGDVRDAGFEDHAVAGRDDGVRSEEHTSELQSLRQIVCRLLVEKKKLITAIALAYEVQCRLCDAASIRARGWYHVTYGAF